MNKRFPGLLRPRVNPEVVMMVCTAGHVDHGKSQLVKLLTGCRMDRLKEEQERGLTIELGFAPCVLEGEVCVGIVDVPGHDKFIRNMVAGVSGIGMTILVIAADDGIMPQTVEHLQILGLLGIRHGMVAMTKIDLVPKERVEALTAEIREFLKGSFLESAPICPVSSETLEGFDGFYETLVREAKGLVGKRAAGVFRMPVLNVFARPGFGAVVTGIPIDGTVEVGDVLEVIPGHAQGKVRSIQRFLRDATSGGHGQCLALNIPELGKSPPIRGNMLAAPGYIEACEVFHLQVRMVPGAETVLKNAEEVKLHTGTTEAPGKVYILESDALRGGETGLATVVLETAAAAAIGDKFILRRASPSETVAGGEILAVAKTGGRGRKKVVVEALRGYLEFFAGVDPTAPEGAARSIECYLCRERPAGAPLRDIALGSLLTLAAARERVIELRAAGKVLDLTADWFVHADAYKACLAEAEARVRKAAAPGQALSLNVIDLRHGLDWPAPLWSRIQADLEARKLVTRKGDRFVLEGAVEKLGDQDRKIIEQVLAIYEAEGFQSPRPDEVAVRLGAPADAVERLVDLLCNRGQLFRPGKNVVLSRSWMKKAQDMVVAIIGEKGSLDSADFKYNLNSTRKYALAILDFLDARRVTVRNDNIRRLSSEYQKHLL